ncbi:hypothetical protein, partial [Streptomyces kanamyceticus]|uniref:hypothetical protein n=1 Tax=Streptomyces kanamyceticus TaxID=1967 RepID=UPI0006E3B950
VDQSGRGVRARVGRGEPPAARPPHEPQVDAEPDAAAAALVDILETVVRDDPMGLRRLVLWELCCALRDGEGTPDEDAAVALGVHRGEAGPLADAVATGFPPAGPARHAAETLNDVWPGVRLRETERLLARLPLDSAYPDGPADHRLTAFVDAVHARSRDVDRLTADGAALESTGALRASADAWLGALRVARDDAHAQTGLLRVAALLADDAFAPSDAAVRADVDDRSVRLSWCEPPRGTSGTGYRVLRFPDGAPELAVETSAHESGPRAVDADAPVGRPLRYAVFPLRRDRLAGVPRVSAPVLLTPDVTELRADAVPDGLLLRWRPDPAAAEVRVTRSSTGADAAGWGAGSLVRVECEHDRLLDTPLAPGTYTYEVRCGYRDPDGGLEWSRGVDVTAHADPWPSPVEELTVRRDVDAGRVTIAWRPPDRGSGLLVPWTAGPVAPGTDLSGFVDRLPAAAPGADTRVELVPRPRERVRMTAVSVLGERAVSGPSVVIEHPGVISDLAVRRVARDRAELGFDWPEPAVLVLVAWSDGRLGGQRRVPRSAYRAGSSVELPVSAAECAITVTPLARPDAVTLGTAPAHAVLPAAPPPPPPPAPPTPPWWSAWWHRWRRPRP